MYIYVRIARKFNGLKGEVSVVEKFPVEMLEHKYREYANLQGADGSPYLNFDKYKSCFIKINLPKASVVPVILEHAVFKKLASMEYVRVENNVNVFNGRHLIALPRLREYLIKTRFLG